MFPTKKRFSGKKIVFQSRLHKAVSAFSCWNIKNKSVGKFKNYTIVLVLQKHGRESHMAELKDWITQK